MVTGPMPVSLGQRNTESDAVRAVIEPGSVIWREKFTAL